jgi:hypothetical protein
MATNDTLTRKQKAFLVALLAEPTVTAAAASIGVAPVTAWRWLRTDAIRAELASRQDAVLAAVTNGLADDAQQARAVLLDTMNAPSTPAGVKVRAALGIIDAALRLCELLTLADRVAALEQRMVNNDTTNAAR